MTDPWVIWAAGFFDGEGCVRISAATPRNLGCLYAEISNTDRRLLAEFPDRFGGRLRKATGMRPDQRQAWVWVATARQAMRFLEAIEPWIESERNRARIELAREFQAGAKYGRHGANPEYRAFRRGCHERMKALNARGR